MAHARRVPLLHLAALNPYVTAAMGVAGPKQGWSVARQASSAAALEASAPSVTCGVSAFAFQVKCSSVC